MSMQYEYKLRTQRAHDERTTNLTRYLATDKTLHENFRSDDRVEKKRINKELRAAANEQYTKDQLEFAAQQQAHEAMLREQDERLASALAAQTTQDEREMRNIQRVCEQSEELRELEEKLKQAYMNKEREVQVMEAAALSAEQSNHDMLVAEAMESERQRGLQAEAYRDFLRKEDGKQMRHVLAKQIQEKEDKRLAAYDEFLKEKSMVDKVVAAILAEEAEEKRAREAKEAETRQYIDDFIKEREQFKREQMEQMEMENAKIRKYAEQVMTRELELRMAREKDQNTKDAILQEMSAKMAMRQAEQDEMDRLRNELILQETEEAIIQKEKEKMERAIQQRLDVALANEYQRQLKLIKRVEEKEDEDHFRAAMLEKFAEDERIDQLNAQKRRQKQIEHRHEIERLLEERRARFEEERSKEMCDMIEASRVAEIRNQIIEEERKRMLAVHAKNLGLRHLPKGVLLSEDDAKIFDA